MEITGYADQNSPGVFDAILGSVVAGISTYRNETAVDYNAAAIAADPSLSGGGNGLLILLAVVVVGYFVFEG